MAYFGCYSITMKAIIANCQILEIIVAVDYYRSQQITAEYRSYFTINYQIHRDYY